MSIEDIFSRLSAHMVKGMMIHDRLSDYYLFLNLDGYATCHEYHFFAESMSYRRMCRYFSSVYGEIVNDSRIEIPEVIPDIWFRNTKKDVSSSEKRRAVRDGLDKWAMWEEETKAFYQSIYSELADMGEISALDFIMGLIKDVSEELIKVHGYQIDKCATDYDMVLILEEQKPCKEKYLRKLNELSA